MIIFLCASPSVVQPKNSLDKNSVTQKWLKQIKEKNFDELCQLDEVCFMTLSMKPPHSELNAGHLVRGFHFKSSFFGKTISSSNQRSYALFLFYFGHFLVVQAIHHLKQTRLPPDYESGLIFKVFALHFQMQRLESKLVVFVCYLLLALLADTVVWLAVAVSRDVTVQELAHPWLYRYLFKIGQFHKNVFYEHEQVGKWAKICNLAKFWLKSNDPKEASSAAQVKEKEENYIELANLSSNRDL